MFLAVFIPFAFHPIIADALCFFLTLYYCSDTFVLHSPHTRKSNLFIALRLRDFAFCKKFRHGVRSRASEFLFFFQPPPPSHSLLCLVHYMPFYSFQRYIPPPIPIVVENIELVSVSWRWFRPYEFLHGTYEHVAWAHTQSKPQSNTREHYESCVAHSTSLVHVANTNTHTHTLNSL